MLRAALWIEWYGERVIFRCGLKVFLICFFDPLSDWNEELINLYRVAYYYYFFFSNKCVIIIDETICMILAILSTFYTNLLHRTFIAPLSCIQIILRKDVHIYSLH